MFVPVSDALVHAVGFGTGSRALVALGGWTGGWEVWERPFELLVADGWRCVGMDHRGAGETVVPPEAISVSAMSSDLVAVMDAYGVDRAVLAAESMGAVVALDVAVRHPGRVAGLLLVSPAPAITPESSGALVAGTRADYPATVAGFVALGMPEAGAGHLRRWARDILGRSEPEAAARLLECCYGVWTDPREVRVPVAVVHGRADAVVPLSVVEPYVAAFPDAALHVLDGVGHAPTMTAPDHVVAALAAPPLAGVSAPR